MDGRQTPMRNHPVFIAQHATATCCRGCLEKVTVQSSHDSGKGRLLSIRGQHLLQPVQNTSVLKP
jgi:hypothetical protein